MVCMYILTKMTGILHTIIASGRIDLGVWVFSIALIGLGRMGVQKRRSLDCSGRSKSSRLLLVSLRFCSGMVSCFRAFSFQTLKRRHTALTPDNRWLPVSIPAIPPSHGVSDKSVRFHSISFYLVPLLGFAHCGFTPLLVRRCHAPYSNTKLDDLQDWRRRSIRKRFRTDDSKLHAPAPSTRNCE